jgi:hypothetical protein
MGMPGVNPFLQSGTLNIPSGTSPILGDIATGVNLAGNLYGMYGGINLENQARNVLAQSNPFGGYRPMYGAMLAQLMQDPSSIARDPGYQFLLSQGTEAINRQAAAGGGVGFGSTADKALLERFGAGELANQFLQQQIQTLTGLSGANIPPANPAAALAALGGAQGTLGASGTGLINSALQMVNRFWPGTSGQTPAFGQMGATGYPVAYPGQVPAEPPPDLAAYTGGDTGTASWLDWTGGGGGAVDMGGMFGQG